MDADILIPPKLASWSVTDLARVRKRMVDQKITAGPDFTLKQVYEAHEIRTLEGLSEGEVAYTPPKIMGVIVRRCRLYPEQKISFKDLWETMNRGEYPGGQAPIKPIKDCLWWISAFCAAYQIPLVSILVVQNGSRKIGTDTSRAFFREWSGLTPYCKAETHEEYAEKMTDLALAVSQETLDCLK